MKKQSLKAFLLLAILIFTLNSVAFANDLTNSDFNLTVTQNGNSHSIDLLSNIDVLNHTLGAAQSVVNRNMEVPVTDYHYRDIVVVSDNSGRIVCIAGGLVSTPRGIKKYTNTEQDVINAYGDPDYTKDFSKNGTTRKGLIYAMPNGKKLIFKISGSGKVISVQADVFSVSRDYF